jgi:hypothetical protein
MAENGPNGFARHEGYLENIGFFGALTSRQTYLNVAYLLLSFPLGIFYFVLIITGISLGFGLAIIGIGILILLALFIAMRGLAVWERQLAIWLLGAYILPPLARAESWQHPWIALKKYVSDAYTWKCLAYFLLKFPLAIASFIITVFLASFTLGLLSAPLFYRYMQVNLLFWHVTRADEALFCFAVGLLFALVSVHVINAIAILCRAFAVSLLSVAPARLSQLRTGPIVIH